MKTLISSLILVAAMAAHGQTPALRLNVDGKPVQATIIETNGTIYIPLADAARALGCDVSATGTTVNVTSKPAAAAKPADTATGPQDAKGEDESPEKLGERVRQFDFKPGSTKDFYDPISSYKDNELDADNRYKNHVCRLMGTVDRVGKEDDGSIFVIMETLSQSSTTGKYLDEAVCYFPPSEAKAAATLQSGRSIIMRGVCAGKVRHSPVLIKLIGCHVDELIGVIYDVTRDIPEDLGGGVGTNTMPVSIAARTGTIMVTVKYSDDYDAKSHLWLLTQDDANWVRKEYGGDGVVLIPESATVYSALAEDFTRFRVPLSRNCRVMNNEDVRFSKITPGDYILVVKSRQAKGESTRDRSGRFFFQKMSVKANTTSKVFIDTSK